MALANHTLNGTSLSALGIEKAVTTHVSLAADKLVIEVPVANLETAAHLLSPFQPVSLADPAGAIVFRGYLLRPPRQATGNDERAIYEIDGLWVRLARTTYKQTWRYYNGPDVTTITTGDSGRVVLGASINSETGALTRISIIEQIESALGQAGVAYDLGGVPNIQAPWADKTDLFISDVVLNQLRWCPHVATRWDYSSSTLEFVNGLAAPPLALDPTAAPQGTRMETGRPVPRYDLYFPVFKVRYMGVTAQGKRYLARLEESTASAVPGAFGTIEATIELGVDEPVPSIGLAAAAHAAYKSVWHEVEITLAAEEPAWWLAVGDRVSLTRMGGTYVGIIQQITRDIGSGLTQILAGPPGHLGVADLYALLDHEQTRKSVSISSPATGVEPAPPGSSPSDPELPEGSSGDPWELIPCDADGNARDINAEDPADRPTHVRWCAGGAGTYSAEDLGFNPGDNPYVIISPGAETHFYLHVQWTESTGEITEVQKDDAASIPDNGTGSFYLPIGSATKSGGKITGCQNDFKGYISIETCRLWWESTARYKVIVAGTSSE